LSFEQKVEGRVEPRLSSGIEALDRVIGGFPTGSVVAIAGKPGSGHDLFVQQILFNAASSGKKVTYLSIDRPPEDVVSDLQSLKLSLDELVGNQRWNFLNGFDARMKINKGELGKKVLLDMLEAVSKSAKSGDWTGVDTLSKLLESNDTKEVTPLIDDLLVEAREGRGLHFLILVEELHDSRTIASLAQLCDGYIRMSLDESRNEPSGTIRIEKLRRANSVQRGLNYLIGPDGIVIETATRIL
jgi:KaiC/GvpD/RAD55 family RecA-like ATPase